MSRRNGRRVWTVKNGVAVPAFGPSTYSGNVVYLMGDSGFTTGATSTWVDQSPGTLGNWTQSTSARVPSATTIGGVAAVSFPGVAGSGTYSYLQGPALNSLTAAHAFVVLQGSIDSLGHGMWNFGLGGSGSESFMPYLNSLVYDMFGSTTRQSTGITLGSSAVVAEFISTSTEWTFRINGGSTVGTDYYTTATNTVGFSTAGSLLGCTVSAANSVSPATNYPFAGKLGAVLVYNAKKSSGNAASIVSALRTKFSI